MLSATFKDSYTKKGKQKLLSYMDGWPKQRISVISIVLSFVVKPLITREVRSHLKKFADKVSVEVFARNLKQLLLTHPVKGLKILGIDPGFKNGCKMAVISEQNDVLATDTMYIHTNKNSDARQKYEMQLAHILEHHR